MIQPPPRHYAIGAARFEAESIAPGLYLVATPIGNLADVTLRALATLAAVDVVLCEDTRTTARLLERYAIKTRREPYHEHNAERVRPRIIDRLKAGGSAALVSDAGMPLVSDPGYRLAREAVAAGIPVTVCPGPSAVLAGLALAGLPTDRFLFAGFVPAKAGERRRLFTDLAAVPATLIFFESPHRIVESLEAVAQCCPGREVAVARELTKLHEEVLRGSAGEIAAALAQRPSVKGEITLLIAPPAAPAAPAEDELQEAIVAAMARLPAGRAASELARRFNLSRAEVYARIVALRQHHEA
jgi:16S rRNA (cytidine1402-2'-O)-methyltransferase